MTSKSDECNYEAILKEFEKKGIINKELDKVKDNLFSEFMSTLTNYYIEKNKLINSEAINNQHHGRLSNYINMINGICPEQKLLDEKLSKLENQQLEMQIKKREIISQFCEKMDIIYNDLQKLPQEYDCNNIKESIQTNLINKRFCNETIPKLQQEIDSMKELVKNFEPCEIPDIDKITKLIQKESLNCFGEPLKIQNCLATIRQKNKALVEKCIV
ncbi:hypothetical protein RN001_008288 [Aquatica leii]|uniref:Uncharacterized protein n=1 Tax=Aquatica leii TaxID=1421715 RepID=A0AAN7SGJ3_9COLE|nr:hypothetical protein RN001_008288 [Aquatica leii]